MAVCRRCFVSGRVQGVSYRAVAKNKAGELGLNGYARNLADGRVELLICGDATAMDTFCAWLWQGPPQAQVSDVTCMEVEVAMPQGFRID